MSTVFTVNFRREAYQRELARARRRVFMLGMWLAYFGAIGVLVGLYGLNCVALQRRSGQFERQTTRLRALQATNAEWHPGPGDIGQVERCVRNPRTWRERLLHLPRVLPSNARITALAHNPENASGADGKLVISGQVRLAPGEDRVRSVMQFVTALSRDSVFAAAYPSIRLVSTRAGDASEGSAEFVIECR